MNMPYISTLSPPPQKHIHKTTQTHKMVSLPTIIKSNERIAAHLPTGLVAVFVGGTSGVGEYTLLKFAKYVPKPRVYIVGRSQEAAERIVKQCMELNPDGKFEFIKSDISLLVNVDDVCRQIKRKETIINILFLSQGTMAFKTSTFSSSAIASSILRYLHYSNKRLNSVLIAFTETSEGLPLVISLAMHSRLRFIQNLLPLIQKAPSLRRVISVGAATTEGEIDTTNISGDGFPLLKWRNQLASCITLLLEETSRLAPEVSFIHTVPGVVKSGIMRQAEGFTLRLIIVISSLFAPFLQTPPEECGQRHLMITTSGMYPSREETDVSAGVPLDDGLVIARGSDGNTGSGVYSIGVKGESAPTRVEELLAIFRDDGTAEKVVEYVKKIAKEITGTEKIND